MLGEAMESSPTPLEFANVCVRRARLALPPVALAPSQHYGVDRTLDTFTRIWP